jgi:phi13 family phage major tail protein
MSGFLAPMIGLDGCYLAKLSTDVAGGSATWGTPVSVPGIVKASIKANGALITDWADNRQFFLTNSRGNTQGSFEFVDIDPTLLADMLGQTRANGITEERPLDQSNYYAVGFRVWIGGNQSDGSAIYRYVWLLKGKFALPDLDGETKKETISPKHIALSAEFIAINGGNNQIMASGRNDWDLTIGSTWFNQPVYSSSVSLSAVTVGTVTGSASAHTLTIPFTKGSSETFALVAPTDDTRIVITANTTGLLLAGTNAYVASVAGTAPTITITNANISAASYNVAVVNVIDSNGVKATPKAQDVTVS